jgi:hypothetical protein
MPYYLYIVTPSETGTAKSLEYLSQFDKFKTAKNEAKRLRAETPLEDGRYYKIMFAENQSEAEQHLKEYREQTVVKEWEK